MMVFPALRIANGLGGQDRAGATYIGGCEKLGFYNGGKNGSAASGLGHGRGYLLLDERGSNLHQSRCAAVGNPGAQAAGM